MNILSTEASLRYQDKKSTMLLQILIATQLKTCLPWSSDLQLKRLMEDRKTIILPANDLNLLGK